MNIIECIYRFNLNHNLIFNQQINSVPVVKFYFFINNGHGFFFLYPETGMF